MTVPSIRLTDPVGSGPLLVLGPSLGTSTILWSTTIPALAEHFTVVAWDLPGHGSSPAASESFTVGELADAVADAVAGPFRYAGVSLGGMTGIELLLRHPERVTAAAIICSGAKIGDASGWHDRTVQVRAQGTASLIIQSAQRWFAPGAVERNPEIAGRLLHALRDADDESYALCCEAIAGCDVRDRLDEIAVPVLAAFGVFDQVTPEASSREIADGVRNGVAVGIADAAHLAPADNAEGTASALLDFFRGSAA